jgi:iron complex transport system permease protein
MRRFQLFLLPLAIVGLSLLDLGIFTDDIALNSDIFTQFRIPRVLGALFAGAGLSAVGLIMQTLFRNPLAGPYLLGVTPGASLGMAIVVFSFPGLTNSFSPLVGSLVGALSALGLQLLMNKGFESTSRLLLTGMVLSFVFGAGVELLQQFGDGEQIKQFTFWGMGSFERIQSDQLFLLLAPTLVGVVYIWWNRYVLDSYLLGDIYAISSGSSINTLRRGMILIGGLLAGWITAYIGPIGFVGLVAPHIAKRLNQTESHGKILLPNLFWGMMLCVSADYLAHHLFEGLILQVNPICALIGAPILLYSFIKDGKHRSDSL